MMKARRLAGLLGILIAVGFGTSTAFGYWSGFETTLHGTGAGSSGAINQGAAPTPVSHGANVVLTWGPSTLTSGQAVDGYVVRRYDAASDSEQTILSECTGTIAATTCTESDVPAGIWKYTVTPVVAGNWRGEESVHSGVVQTGPIVLELDRTVIGPPLPTEISGTLSGFSPDEGITYELDGNPIAGSPSSVGADGGASISSLTIPAGVADGAHTISVLGDNAVAPSDAEASILVDTTPPAINAFTTPEPNGAGWNSTSPVEVNGTVEDGSGSGIAYVKYTDDGTNPKTSPTAQFALAPLSVAATTTYKFFGVDLAGNESPVETLEVRIDSTPPYFSVDLAEVEGNAFITPPTPQGAPGHIYYRGSAAGSFRFKIIPIPTGGSPTVSAGFTPLSAETVGFSFDSSSITAPAGGPYLSNPLSWVAGTSSNPSGTITVIDAAGNSLGDAGTIFNDSTPPSGGSVDANGLIGAGNRYSNSLDLELDLADGSDAASGMADGSIPGDRPSQLLRSSAPLTSGDGVADGTCGTYGAYSQVGIDDPPSSLSDTVPADSTCYRYRYLVHDHVANVATYESPDIKVKSAATPSLRPTNATITPVSGLAAQAVSGSTVYYNPADSGSFDVETSASAPYVGIAHLTFPAIPGFTGGGSVAEPLNGNTYRTTYAWSANGSFASPGAQPISATDNAGNSSSNDTALSVVKDDVAPGGGSLDATGLGGTGGRYSTTTTLSIGLDAGTDSGSGLATAGRRLLRASASLTSDGTGNGSCGSFGAYTQIGANDPTSPKTDTVPVDRICYRYRYAVPDRVGNQATYTSPDIKVDAAAPPTPALSFSGLSNASWSGTGTAVFYRPAAAAGGFTLTATSADTTSGTTSYDFPTLPAGWSSTSGGPGVRNYSWSAPNPAIPSGSQVVTAHNNAGGQSSSNFSVAVTTDGTPPSGGSISYSNGYNTSSYLSVNTAKGTDTGGSGLASGSGLLQRSTAPFSNGVCGTFGAFTTIAANPSSSYLTQVPAGCHQFRYLIFDNVGNQATYTSSSVVKLDRDIPTNSTTITSAVGAVTAFNAATLYYKGDAPGSFRFVNTVLDDTSGPGSTTFPDIATSGWTHDAETITTPGGGPYTSSTYSWTANPGNPELQNLVGRDAAGLARNKPIGFISDISAPGFGSISYPSAIVNTTSVPISLSIGNDQGSGVDPATAIVTRDEAPLTTITETCGAFADTFDTTVTLVDGADTSVSSGKCYRYRYIVSDKVGNVTTYTSASVVKVDTRGPRVTAITSKQSDGNPGDGKLQIGDKLTLTFNQSLAGASVPTSFSGATETSPGAFVPVTLNVPGITAGAVGTGSPSYMPASTTATFGGTVGLTNNGSATTVVLTVTTLSGGPTSTGNGVLDFAPAATILDGGGNSAAGVYSTVSAFKLF